MKNVKNYVKEIAFMRRVITYGTYDLLHYGHIELLRRAREMGDYLMLLYLQMNSIKLRIKSHIMIMNNVK